MCYFKTIGHEIRQRVGKIILTVKFEPLLPELGLISSTVSGKVIAPMTGGLDHNGNSLALTRLVELLRWCSLHISHDIGIGLIVDIIAGFAGYVGLGEVVQGC